MPLVTRSQPPAGNALFIFADGDDQPVLTTDLGRT